MVIRVALVVCLCLGFLGMGVGTPDSAFGRMLMPAAGCAPAPTYCGPPNPFTLCGALLAGCTGSCGACLEIPSAIMAGLLAPPRCRRARRAVCAPAPVCYPAYTPPPCPPQPITKCKPAVQSVPCAQPAVQYPVAPVCRPAPCAPSCGYGGVPARYYRPFRPRLSGGCGGPAPVFGCGAVCANLLGIPFRLVSGALSVPAPMGPDFFAGGGVSATGRYW
jgi:hypothetical protein